MRNVNVQGCAAHLPVVRMIGDAQHSSSVAGWRRPWRLPDQWPLLVGVEEPEALKSPPSHGSLGHPGRAGSNVARAREADKTDGCVCGQRRLHWSACRHWFRRRIDYVRVVPAGGTTRLVPRRAPAPAARTAKLKHLSPAGVTWLLVGGLGAVGGGQTLKLWQSTYDAPSSGGFWLAWNERRPSQNRGFVAGTIRVRARVPRSRPERNRRRVSEG
jgi:hypothetical protein